MLLIQPNMANKSILLAVADAKAVGDITQALGTDWEVTSVASGEDALGQFEKRSFDAFLVDFNLGSPDASDLLNLALEKHPKTIRFLLAHEADLALVAAKVEGSPQILPKPIEPASLKSRIEDGVKDENSEQGNSDPQPNAPTVEPCVPSIYAEVLKALEAPDATNEKIAEIVAQDTGLTSELLSLTKSSSLGQPRKISSPVEAVETLGLEAVKAAVMALQFLAEHSQLRPAYLSLDQLWQHSINVGQIARDLVLFETKDSALASQALIGGLLHDLGKVVLAKNFDDLYGRVHSLARKQPVAIWDIEKEMFGANHGEIGACLVGMWNMPSAIVDATAFHHEPAVADAEQLTALTAVHIANVLERELWLGVEETVVAPVINTQLLNELGLLQRLPIWRAAFANHSSASQRAELESAREEQTTVLPVTRGTRTTNPLAGRAVATRTATLRVPRTEDDAAADEIRYRRNRIYGGAAVILVLLTIWFRTQPQNNHGELAFARTPAGHETPAPVTALPSSETPAQAPPVEVPKIAAPVVAPTVAVSEPPAQSTAPAPAPRPTSTTAPAPSTATATPPPSETLSKPTASVPQPEPAAATAPRAAATNVVASIVPEKKIPVFRLHGIIYTHDQPAAIINGQTVNLGDEVDGATVVAIGRTTVTLKIDGERKTYVLR
jgi:HD-like signal output (HDOD) protein/ActR/RegA family two-component response regulator